MADYGYNCGYNYSYNYVYNYGIVNNCNGGVRLSALLMLEHNHFYLRGHFLETQQLIVNISSGGERSSAQT